MAPTAVGEDDDGFIYVADDGSRGVRRIDPGSGRASLLRLRYILIEDQWRPYGPLAALRMLEALAPGPRRSLYLAAGFRVWRWSGSGLTTVAGTGRYGFSGDGGPATRAETGPIAGLALDASGNIYFSDPDNHAIRKVETRTGIIFTVAGGPGAGTTGEGAPARSAKLLHPRGLAVDAGGNIFYADAQANVVRQIDAAAHLVRTIAGNGARGAAGDGGPAKSASLDQPSSVAVAPGGDVYIGQAGAVRKVTARTGVITTVVGGGPRRLAEADGRLGTDVMLPGRVGQLFYSRRNALLVALPDDNFVAELEVKTGVFRVVAGNPLWVGDGSRAVISPLSAPDKLALDAAGNLYIADSGHARILQATTGPSGAGSGRLTIVAGTGVAGSAGDGVPAAQASIAAPSGIWVDAGNSVYFTERGSRVRRVGADGVLRTVAGSAATGFAGDGGPAVAAQLNSAGAITGDAAGNLYLADNGNRRVRMVDRKGIIRTIAGTGEYGDSGDGGPAVKATLAWISDLLLDGRGGLLLADSTGNRVRRLDLATGIISAFAGNIGSPEALARDRQGNVYVMGWGSLRRVDARTGTVAGIPVEGLARCKGMVVDRAGNIIFSDPDNNRIKRISLERAPTR